VGKAGLEKQKQAFQEASPAGIVVEAKFTNSLAPVGLNLANSWPFQADLDEPLVEAISASVSESPPGSAGEATEV